MVAYPSEIAEWFWRNTEGPERPERRAIPDLTGWKDIGNRLKRSPRTAQRWADTDGLPVYRLLGTTIYADSVELGVWLHREDQGPAPCPTSARAVAAQLEGND